MAGLYGALHNQISYTVSPEYFHDLKFAQFGISEGLHNRIGAGLVGLLASWWMGLVIGAPILITGLIFRDGRRYAIHVLIAFAVVIAMALLTGVGALVYSFSVPQSPVLSGYRIPHTVSDPTAYCRAATTHNFSYLGGVIGIFTGIGYLVVARIRAGSEGRGA